MRRAKRITALAVAAAMVLSNVAYAAPDTNTTTTQQVPNLLIPKAMHREA